MGNENTALPSGETPGGVTPTGETPTMQTGETPGSTPKQSSPDDAQKEIDRLAASLKRANAEAKEHRQKAEELDKLKAEIEAAKLTEAERQAKEYADLQASNEDLAAALMEMHVNQDIARLAKKFNFVIDEPELIARMIDWKAIEWDEETGRPINIEKLLESLVESAPKLVDNKRPAPTSGGATNPPRSATQSSEINDAYIASLTPQAYNALSPEMRTRISQYLANRVATRR